MNARVTARFVFWSLAPWLAYSQSFAQAPATQPGNPPATAPAPPAGNTAPTPSPLGTGEKPPEWPKEIDGKDLKGWLVELKESPDGAIREQAVKIIPQFGPSARKEALNTFVTVLGRETDPGVRVNIIILLGSIAPDDAVEGRKVVEPLKNLLANSANGSPMRLYSARALTNLAAYAQDTLPQYKAASEDNSWETRLAVAQAMGVIFRPVDEKKGPNLGALDLLKDRLKTEKSAAVRMELVQSLLVLGPPAFKDPMEYPKVVGPYFKAVTDHMKVEKDKAIQVWLYMLLMRYDGSQLTDTTIKKIADHVVGPEIPARVAALRALGLLDERAKPYIPTMLDAVKLDEPTTKLEALNALSALRTNAREAIPELEKLKNDSKNETLKTIYAQTIEIIQGRKPLAPPMPPKK
jgi:HEAT repeat protein